MQHRGEGGVRAGTRISTQINLVASERGSQPRIESVDAASENERWKERKERGTEREREREREKNVPSRLWTLLAARNRSWIACKSARCSARVVSCDWQCRMSALSGSASRKESSRRAGDWRYATKFENPDRLRDILTSSFSSFCCFFFFFHFLERRRLRVQNWINSFYDGGYDRRRSNINSCCVSTPRE